MLMPAKKLGESELSYVESQIVSVYRLEEDNTFVMEAPGQTYIVHPDDIDTYWQETYQLIFGFTWEYSDEIDWNNLDDFEDEDERDRVYQLFQEETERVRKAGKV
jgi:hypothetical protein